MSRQLRVCPNGRCVGDRLGLILPGRERFEDAAGDAHLSDDALLLLVQARNCSFQAAAAHRRRGYGIIGTGAGADKVNSATRGGQVSLLELDMINGVRKFTSEATGA